MDNEKTTGTIAQEYSNESLGDANKETIEKAAPFFFFEDPLIKGQYSHVFTRKNRDLFTDEDYAASIKVIEVSEFLKLERERDGLRAALDHAITQYSLHISTTPGNHIPMVTKLKAEIEALIKGTL